MSQESRESREDDRSAESGDELAISDDQLPEDLRPSDDNPLAQPGPDSGGTSGDASHPGEGDASDTSSSAEASSETESGRAPAEGLEDSSDE